ncbi:MAG: (d)CMP kinase [Pseudomonadota bacterium]
MKNFVVTIDGPAGSGKSTIAGELALRLGWFVLESGKLYRAVAYIVDKHGQDERSRDVLVKAAKQAADSVRLARTREGLSELVIGGENPGSALKEPQIGRIASILARDQEVRDLLLPLQRSILDDEKFLIAEGRDMGTRVFPDADIKFFITASVDVRAARRTKEQEELGFKQGYDETLKQIRERDERDEQRAASPLKPADDAVTIDTSRMTIRDVVAELMEIISPRIREARESELYEAKIQGTK